MVMGNLQKCMVLATENCCARWHAIRRFPPFDFLLLVWLLPSENGIFDFMKLIMSGDIDSAFKRLGEWYPVYPQVIKDETSVICFLLHSQKFIEYIRAEQLEDAVKYAHANLANFLAHKAFEGLPKESVALLAYEKPAESCIGYLLDSPQHEFVADAVNAAVLSTNPNMEDPESCLYSCLEKLLRQLTVCSFKRCAFNNNQGDAFLLYKEVQTCERSRRS